MPNLYGDILSDVAAQIAGSVGLAGSANVGDLGLMFEAIHGSAPRRAGQNLANPSGLLLGGVMMLVHIGQWEAAERVHNAWLRTIEDGIHTYDIYEERSASKKSARRNSRQAVVARMGMKPEKLTPVSYAGAHQKRKDWTPTPRSVDIQMIGVDLYIGSKGIPPQALGDKVKEITHEGLTLKMIDNRGVIVYPGGMSETFLTDSYRCRFEAAGATVTHAQVAALYQKMAAAGYDIVKTESLRTFDGKPGFTLAQGQ